MQEKRSTRPEKESSQADRTGRVKKSVLFGEILVEEGVLRPEDLQGLLQLQRNEDPETRRTIGQLALEQGFLDRPTLQSLLNRHGWRLHLGELMVMRDHLTLAQLSLAMQEAQQNGERLGETLLRLGLIDPAALAQALAEQCGVAFVPISTIPPSPDLARWINEIFARTHGIVPVACQGRALTVAAWQPRSMLVLEQIEQSTGMQVIGILTTRQDVEERLDAIYSHSEESEAAA